MVVYLLIRLPNPFTNGNDQQLLNALETCSLRPAPTWLGSFDFQMHKSLDKLPTAIANEFEKLNSLVPAQKFNTWFVQRYEPKQNVFAHRDPKNNKDMTIVSLYGETWQTILTVDGTRYNQSPGQIFIFPTTINNQQGPVHSVAWAQETSKPFTTRWALICNTIESK